MRNERVIARQLAPLNAKLFLCLARTREASIDDLFARLYPADVNRITGRRARQQRLGALITQINRKIGYYDLKILPGRARGTYQICYVLDKPIIRPS